MEGKIPYAKAKVRIVFFDEMKDASENKVTAPTEMKNAKCWGGATEGLLCALMSPLAGVGDHVGCLGNWVSLSLDPAPSKL